MIFLFTNYYYLLLGSHFHGHIPECSQYDSKNPQWISHMRKKAQKFFYFDQLSHFYKKFNIDMIFKYEELFDCNFKRHYLHPTIPFNFSYIYTDFLRNIYNKTIKGFLVLNGLSIRKSSRSMYQGNFFYINFFFS